MAERTIARVKACVPAMPGPITWERVAVGWRVHLDCRRECTYRYDHCVPHGTKISHVCDAEDESLPPGVTAGMMSADATDAVFETIVRTA